MVERYNKFVEHNDKVLTKKMPAESLEINGENSGCFELIPAANEQKSQQPGTVWAAKKLKYDLPTEVTSKMDRFHSGGQFCR